MKIGIVTLHLYANYGGILQAYALKTVLQRMGHEVELIDRPFIIDIPLWKMPLSYSKRLVKKYLLGRQVRIFNERYQKKLIPILSQNVIPFINDNIPTRVVQQLNDLHEGDYDAIIVGSDQVWRPRHYHPIEDAYLEFASQWKNFKRVAYAPSFGCDKWEYTSKQTTNCAKLIRLFNAVSVREESGVKLCKEHYGIESQHVLDPTMLLDRKDYEDLFRKVNAPASNGNILSYLLDVTPEKLALVKRFEEKTKWKEFKVNSRFEDPNACVNERIQPPVEQWLRGFNDADFVITDSFHACAFSIIFGKPFIAIGNAERGLERFQSLLKLFNQEYRLVLPSHLSMVDLDKMLQPFDVENNLAEMREKSFEFLKNGLNKLYGTNS